MIPFAEGVWLEIGPARILGMRLTTTMTVIRLRDGSLLLHSPLALTAERRAAVEALGPVTHLYAPSRWHEAHIGEWTIAYPSARLHAPAGLVKERRDLRIDRVLGSVSEPAFVGVLDEFRIEGFRL
jgi:Domain of unknown function (DUF4336)